MFTKQGIYSQIHQSNKAKWHTKRPAIIPVLWRFLKAVITKLYCSKKKKKSLLWNSLCCAFFLSIFFPFLSLLLSVILFYFSFSLSSSCSFLSFLFSYPFAVISTLPHPPPTVILPLSVCPTPQIAFSEVLSADRETKIETWVWNRERERERERETPLSFLSFWVTVIFHLLYCSKPRLSLDPGFSLLWQDSMKGERDTWKETKG